MPSIPGGLINGQEFISLWPAPTIPSQQFRRINAPWEDGIAVSADRLGSESPDRITGVVDLLGGVNVPAVVQGLLALKNTEVTIQIRRGDDLVDYPGFWVWSVRDITPGRGAYSKIHSGGVADGDNLLVTEWVVEHSTGIF